MEQTKPLNFRHGHRERVRTQYLNGFPKGWEDYRILELILFYAIPRKDVKELAHLLIHTFGSLDAVLTAPPEKLCCVPGVGRRTSDILGCFYRSYELAKAKPKRLRF